MIHSQIQREYVRTDNWSISAKVRKDSETERWTEIKMPNIAAGGALIQTDKAFEIGDEVWIDLEIDPITPGITRKIPMNFKSIVRNDRGLTEGLRTYSIEFSGISKNDKTRLDELVQRTNYSSMLNVEADGFGMYGN